MTDSRIIPSNLDSFTLEYIEAALFSTMDESTEQGGEPMDANYRAEDIHPDTLELMAKDCEDFQAQFGALFVGREDEAARDFWFTREGHGCGFWDGDWEDDYPEDQLEGESDEAYAFRSDSSSRYATVGDFLTAMSKPYGEFNLYVGDDGMIHGS
jgi:hypothetical protein